MIYTITLNPSLDYFVKCDQFSLGKTNFADNGRICSGGKGFNVAKMTSSTNVPTKAYGFLAGETGKLFEKLNANTNYQKEYIWIDNGETRINVKLKTDKDTEINTEGPYVKISDLALLVKKLQAEIKPGDILILSGSIPNGLPVDSYKQIIANLPRTIEVIVDTRGKSLIDTLKYHPLLIKPNYFELCELYGRRISSQNEIIDAMRYLQRLGARNVIASLADQGACMLTETGIVCHCQSASQEIVSSVGCGDYLLGGFVSSYVRNNDLTYAFKFGVAASSAKAFSVNDPDNKKIAEVYASTIIEKM